MEKKEKKNGRAMRGRRKMGLGPMNAATSHRAHRCGLGALPHNKSLQLTFDPPPIFAAAKNGVASNAAELRRCASIAENCLPVPFRVAA